MGRMILDSIRNVGKIASSKERGAGRIFLIRMI